MQTSVWLDDVTDDNQGITGLVLMQLVTNLYVVMLI